jgi:hypothetical protein
VQEKCGYEEAIGGGLGLVVDILLDSLHVRSPAAGSTCLLSKKHRRGTSSERLHPYAKV